MNLSILSVIFAKIYILSVITAKNCFRRLMRHHIRDIIKTTSERRQINMIKRESYMKCICPFFGNDLVKALIGFHRSGKSAILDLIKEELCASCVDSSQFISINLRYLYHWIQCQTAFRRTGDLSGRTICGVCDLSLFLCGIYRTIPHDLPECGHPSVLQQISKGRWYALSVQSAL